MSNVELPVILPCSSCGGAKQHLEAARPEGRTTDLWRVVCQCGCSPAQWSVSRPAAVRLWNRYMTGHLGRESG